MKKKGFLQKNIDIVKAFAKKINISIIYIIFFDLIFFASLVILPLSWNKLVMKHPVLAMVDQYGNVANLTLEQIEQITPMLGAFLFLLVGSLIALLVLIFLIYSTTRAVIWAMITKKEFSLKLCKRFALLNLAWLLFFVPAAMLTFIVVALLGMISSSARNYALLYIASFISIVIILIPITITFLTYYYFIKENKIFHSIKEALAIVFRKIRIFLLPFALITIVLIILSNLFRLAPASLRTGQAYMIISGLALLSYIAIVRLYLIAVVEGQ